jgi:hypothetical protein
MDELQPLQVPWRNVLHVIRCQPRGSGQRRAAQLAPVQHRAEVGRLPTPPAGLDRPTAGWRNAQPGPFGIGDRIVQGVKRAAHLNAHFLKARNSGQLPHP